MRVLVADASATMRSLLRNAVRRLPECEVSMASTLDEAKAACETTFDLAVIDRDLSQGADWEWLASLREQACPLGRLIVIGTRVSRAEAIALRELGTGAFLLEPIDPERLRERAEALLAMQPVAEPSGEETAAEAEHDEGDEEPQSKAA
jgi:DNA-binding response OmpR family regulator